MAHSGLETRESVLLPGKFLIQILIPPSLTAPIGYTPRTRPGPPSILRQQAYGEGYELLGPEIDPDGWKVFPAYELKGFLFKALDVTVTFSVCFNVFRASAASLTAPQLAIATPVRPIPPRRSDYYSIILCSCHIHADQ